MMFAWTQQLRHVTQLQKQLEKLDREFDKLNEAMTKGEVCGFNNALLDTNKCCSVL